MRTKTLYIHWPALAPQPHCAFVKQSAADFALEVLALVKPEHRKAAGHFLVNTWLPTLKGQQKK